LLWNKTDWYQTRQQPARTGFTNKGFYSDILTKNPLLITSQKSYFQQKELNAIH